MRTRASARGEKKTAEQGDRYQRRTYPVHVVMPLHHSFPPLLLFASALLDRLHPLQNLPLGRRAHLGVVRACILPLAPGIDPEEQRRFLPVGRLLCGALRFAFFLRLGLGRVGMGG